MRALHGTALALALATLPGACGSPAPAQPDAGLDAGFLCDLPAGWTHLVSQIRYPAGDLDGDGVVDNMIGNIPQTFKDQIHAGLDDSISRGEMEMVLHVTGWSDPPTPDDPESTIHVLTVTDAETPPDPSDNFNYQGQFLVHLGEFDLDCHLRNGSETASLAGGVLTSYRSAWEFPLSTGTGTLMFVDATLITTYTDDFRDSTSRLTGVVPACSLRALPFPGDVQGSTLDAFINEPAIAAVVHIDRDLDGDGLEQVIGDGVTVDHCIDGDGTTIVPGRDCPCHPAIVDGYSITFDSIGVLVTLVGVKPPT